MVVVSRLSPTHQSLTPDDFVQVHKWWTRDAKVAMLEGLSVLELCLVSGIYNVRCCRTGTLAPPQIPFVILFIHYTV